MKRKRSLLLICCYGFLATLAVLYGLLERQSLFATFVFFHLLVCLGIPIFHGKWEGGMKARWQDAWGRHVYDGLGLYCGIATGFILMLGIVAGMWLLLHRGVDAVWIRETLIQWGLTTDWIWPFAVYIIIVNSFLEELLWRGFVMQRLLDGISRWRAMLVSSFFFALYHLIVGVVLFGWKWGAIITGLVFFAGMLWAWMKGKFPSVYATWFSHLLADVGIMISLFLWIF